MGINQGVWVSILFDLSPFQQQQPLSYALQAPQNHGGACWPRWQLSIEQRQEERSWWSTWAQGAKVRGRDNQQGGWEGEEKGAWLKAQPESELCPASW